MNDNINEFGWWIETVTIKPICVYYFGAFSSISEAEQHQAGYMQDLVDEGAEIVNTSIKLCQPKNLTIFSNQPKVDQANVRQGAV